MGAVFAGVNVVTGGAVAIKWLLPEAAAGPDAIARFIQEAQATARVEHPNVIGVLDAGQDGGAPFLVMERLRGSRCGSSARRLAERGPRSPSG
jgi:serine/threonine-protein kinase